MRTSKHRIFPGTKSVKSVREPSNVPMEEGPDIRLVITDYYKGSINNVIYMIIRKAEKVAVSIFSVEGGTLEVGEANNNSSVWSYRTRIPNPDFPGAKVLILATDSQGNQAELAVTVL
ncbi:hypothetical protein [Chitinophaga sp. S165]|uniref:hypothetical protein n=1 Tax=Chitinophaga sp. S165 TaxID=2135462 RepID=UPI000D8EDADD|nr:hypothetical protein [Chitinophaga sp. S165]PWV44631.1 hypothetical protein C7475_1199 [Chitinophaga sp. S165]